MRNKIEPFEKVGPRTFSSSYFHGFHRRGTESVGERANNTAAFERRYANARR